MIFSMMRDSHVEEYWNVVHLHRYMLLHQKEESSALDAHSECSDQTTSLGCTDTGFSCVQFDTSPDFQGR
jgi:hypothetical protein